jgi:hypothetical protein
MLIFFEKRRPTILKKSLGVTKLYEKMGQKNHSRLCLLSFNSKLSHFDININLNLNLNHKCLSPTWRKPIRLVIYGEAREHSELAREIYGERFPQRSQCMNL